MKTLIVLNSIRKIHYSEMTVSESYKWFDVDITKIKYKWLDIFGWFPKEVKEIHKGFSRSLNELMECGTTTELGKPYLKFDRESKIVYNKPYIKIYLKGSYKGGSDDYYYDSNEEMLLALENLKDEFDYSDIAWENF